jgi:hypothetical protein
MEKMRQGPAEPVQFPHNQTIARTHICEGVLQSWPVITSAAGLVGKEMTRIDASVDQRVMLQVCGLAVMLAGHAHIAD